MTPDNHAIDSLTRLLAPAPSELIRAHPVSTEVNDVRNDRPGLIEPVGGSVGHVCGVALSPQRGPEGLGHLIEIIGIGVSVGGAEIEVRQVVDGNHMKMDMGYIETHDDHPDAGRRKRLLLGPTDGLGDHGEMCHQVGWQVDPVVDFESWYHQHMTTVE